jgi:hypothetical protein
VGLVVKHRELARQVGVLIKDPSMNSMASFNFTSTMLDEGTTFVLGSLIYIANGSGGFNNHLANTKEPEASVVSVFNLQAHREIPPSWYCM